MSKNMLCYGTIKTCYAATCKAIMHHEKVKNYNKTKDEDKRKVEVFYKSRAEKTAEQCEKERTYRLTI
jgi:hypothetical protein